MAPIFTAPALALLAVASSLISQASASPHVDTSLRLHGAARRAHVQPGTALRLRSEKRRADAQTSSSGSAGSSTLKKRTNKKKRTCKSSSSTSSASISSGTASVRNATGSSTTSSSSSGSSSVSSLGSQFLSKNGLYWGYLPDEADAGGTKQTMAQINSWTGSKSAFYGYYAQARSGTTFDGSQLLAVIDDVKASGAIFQPAVMPTGGWQGLTSSDNSQAVAIAKVMKQFTDEGIEVWLRFAHEVNWYQTDGTYSGGVSDFQAGWKAVSDAMDQYAPDVKMFFTPNVGSNSDYDKYYPTAGRVDIIGIDYYPSQSGTFVSRMQYFHDKYTSDTVKFAIGETGWGQSTDIATRLAYVEELTSDATLKALPNYIGCSWFNFYKGYDFRIVTGDDSTTQQTVSFFKS